ncbi:MAG: hypothetical protein IKQ77_12540 [Prevotella sp.]|nr:hypothetical protein [Prevotella sp.]
MLQNHQKDDRVGGRTEHWDGNEWFRQSLLAVPNGRFPVAIHWNEPRKALFLKKNGEKFARNKKLL